VLDLVGATTEELAERLAGHDAVVFAAGAHGTGGDTPVAEAVTDLLV
jgi:hypothetical protein